MSDVSVHFLTDEDLEALLAAERERCAKVAERYKFWLMHGDVANPAIANALAIAAAIRALPPQAEES